MKNIDEYSKYFKTGGEYENDRALADIFRAREIFANISSIDIMGLDSKAEFDKVLKEIYNSYRKMVE